ncbi:MAG TPA: FecR family protein, partial [Pelobium sp.]|nr:FecR family protein [Pelobium sp.]
KGWMAAASIIAVLFTTGIYFYVQNQKTSSFIIGKTKVDNDILPGGNRATLVLSDGSKIVLEDAENGLIKKEGSAEINKLNTSLVYKISGEKAASNVYNTVSTPNGGQYQIQLEDGTRVWLNAASSLRFPIAFTGKERIVELKGEAYFEVAKNDKLPFKVNIHNDNISKMMQIEVLGTHFNVLAYADEDFKTTLTEGSVSVSSQSQQRLVLKPGEQSILTNSGKMKVKAANIKEALAWKNGLFVFDRENIGSIMKKLSRWYNIDVEYASGLADKEFVGTISRNENLSEVLKMLALTGTVEFDVKGKKIIVK